MRKLFSSFIMALMLAASFAPTLSADDKKDDKKNDKDKEVHKPVLIVVYVPAWDPVIRATSQQSVVDTYVLSVEDSSISF